MKHVDSGARLEGITMAELPPEFFPQGRSVDWLASEVARRESTRTLTGCKRDIGGCAGPRPRASLRPTSWWTSGNLSLPMWRGVQVMAAQSPLTTLHACTRPGGSQHDEVEDSEFAKGLAKALGKEAGKDSAALSLSQLHAAWDGREHAVTRVRLATRMRTAQVRSSGGGDRAAAARPVHGSQA